MAPSCRTPRAAACWNDSAENPGPQTAPRRRLWFRAHCLSVCKTGRCSLPHSAHSTRHASPSVSRLPPGQTQRAPSTPASTAPMGTTAHPAPQLSSHCTCVVQSVVCVHSHSEQVTSELCSGQGECGYRGHHGPGSWKGAERPLQVAENRGGCPQGIKRTRSDVSADFTARGDLHCC